MKIRLLLLLMLALCCLAGCLEQLGPKINQANQKAMTVITDPNGVVQGVGNAMVTISETGAVVVEGLPIPMAVKLKILALLGVVGVAGAAIGKWKLPRKEAVTHASS